MNFLEFSTLYNKQMLIFVSIHDTIFLETKNFCHEKVLCHLFGLVFIIFQSINNRIGNCIRISIY